jgi:hypothetical protein
MEVNLCPSTKIGQVSCSVRTSKEERVFIESENEAVVSLDQSVTIINQDTGEIQVSHISPESAEVISVSSDEENESIGDDTNSSDNTLGCQTTEEGN